MSRIEVRRFAATDWREYRYQRLRALSDSPDAFGSTFEESSRIEEERWRERLADLDEGIDAPLRASFDDEFGGMAWATLSNDSEAVAHLYQMWVAPSARGYGVGAALLSAAIEWVREQHIPELVLSVTLGNSAARRLYERHEFKAVGPSEPLRPGSDLQSQTMVLRVSG